MKKKKKILARLGLLQTTLSAHLKPPLHRFARLNVVATNPEGGAMIVGALLYDPEIGLTNPKLCKEMVVVIQEYQRLHPRDYTHWKWCISHHMEQLLIPGPGQTIRVVYETSEEREIKL